MSVSQSRPRPCCLPSNCNYKLLLSEMHPAPFTMLGIVARLAEMTVPQAASAVSSCGLPLHPLH